MVRLSKGGLHPAGCALYFVLDLTNPQVDVPHAVRAEHSPYLTLVFQHRQWDVFHEGDQFSVLLTFNRVPYRVRSPYSAVVHAYTVGEPINVLELKIVPAPMPEQSDDGKIVRVDFQAKRRV